jgi:type I restriction enzyme, S subunit
VTPGSNAIALKSGQHSDYLNLHFISQLAQDAITSIVAGSAQPKFNKTDFRNLKIVVASPEILNSFNAVISPLKHHQLNVNKETHSLEELRDALLPKLISGELLVPDAEKLLAESPL